MIASAYNSSALCVTKNHDCFCSHNLGSKLHTAEDIFIKDVASNTYAENIDYNKMFLNQIVIAESSKVYLVKDVAEINKNAVFKPYKDLCAKIAEVISEYSPKYKYPKSLSTTLIETSHNQQYFSINLPRLTDATPKNRAEFTGQFLEDLLFKSIS